MSTLLLPPRLVDSRLNDIKLAPSSGPLHDALASCSSADRIAIAAANRRCRIQTRVEFVSIRAMAHRAPDMAHCVSRWADRMRTDALFSGFGACVSGCWSHREQEDGAGVHISRTSRAEKVAEHLSRPKVRIDAAAGFEPDVVVSCAAVPDGLLVPEPLIVVEVLSPSTRDKDFTVKLAGYAALPSVAHHLLVDTQRRLVVHHHRSPGEQDFRTSIARSGTLRLDPLGLDLDLDAIYAGSGT